MNDMRSTGRGHALPGFESVDTRRALPLFVIPTAAVIFLTLGVGPNVLIALLACGVLIFGTFILWRPGEIPMLLFIFLYQWLQASLGIFYANLSGSELDRAGLLGGQQTTATLLVLLGLSFLTIGMRCGSGQSRADLVLEIRRQVEAQPQSMWIRLFIATWLFATVMGALGMVLPGLRQLLGGFAALKWAGFLVLTYATFSTTNGRKTIWLAIFLAELAISVGGYFSSFKEVFFFTLLGLAATRIRITPKMVVLGGCLVLPMFYCILVWTAIKPQYRIFLSGGELSQTVTVSYGDALNKLVELGSNLSSAELTSAMDTVARRAMYVEYFGVVLNTVPSIIPHENGDIWLDAILRPLMPRVFFPDKAVIDDSALTNKYTLLSVAGADTGTSISLGYMCETYIDFGEWMMMPMIFLVGLVLGRIYRWFMYTSAARGLLGMALATCALMPATYLENSTPKLTGGLFGSCLACWLVVRFVIPRIMPWISAPQIRPGNYASGPQR